LLILREQPDNVGRRIPACPTFEVVDALSPLGFSFALREKKSGSLLSLE
jgi:hypothetical protein